MDCLAHLLQADAPVEIMLYVLDCLANASPVFCRLLLFTVLCPHGFCLHVQKTLQAGRYLKPVQGL